MRPNHITSRQLPSRGIAQGAVNTIEAALAKSSAGEILCDDDLKQCRAALAVLSRMAPRDVALTHKLRTLLPRLDAAGRENLRRKGIGGQS
jgi:hypothetical protein